MGYVGGMLGICWFYVGPSWAHVGPSWAYVVSHVGPSWAYVGPSWAHVGPMFGGPLLGHVELKFGNLADFRSL